MQPCFAASLAASRCACGARAPRRLRAAPHGARAAARVRPPRAAIPSNGAISATPRRYEGVSWATVERMCKHIADQARGERFDAVLAVTRGGLVPAVLLCEQFELRNILSATVMFYADNGEQFFGMTEPRFLAFPSVDALQARSVLIVDDVWDSGRTAHAVRNRVLRAKPKLVKVAVLHYKPHNNLFPAVQPDFYSATTTDWIVYPWEKASPKAPHVSFDPNQPTVSNESIDNSPSVNN